MHDPITAASRKVASLIRLVQDPDDLGTMTEVLTEGLGCAVTLTREGDGIVVDVRLPIVVQPVKVLTVVGLPGPPEDEPIEITIVDDPPQEDDNRPPRRPAPAPLDDDAFHALGFPDLGED